jgi:hypothetical protein
VKRQSQAGGGLDRCRASFDFAQDDFFLTSSGDAIRDRLHPERIEGRTIVVQALAASIPFSLTARQA